MTFDSFSSSLSNLDKIQFRQDPVMTLTAASFIAELQSIPEINKESIVEFIKVNPSSIPLIATAGGLGQEQLKNQLKYQFSTSSWTKLAKEKSCELVEYFDTEYNIISRLNSELTREWKYQDILVERHLWSRKHGASSVGRGRRIEDEVENIIKSLGVPYAMRARFSGRGGDTAPCDLCIPGVLADARIVIAMKGFNSTGSKLTDAVTEIQKMADVRLPSQYVFAVVDGIGWMSRKADLQRIYDLYSDNMIDGLYTLQTLDSLTHDIKVAVQRLNLKYFP